MTLFFRPVRAVIERLGSLWAARYPRVDRMRAAVCHHGVMLRCMRSGAIRRASYTASRIGVMLPPEFGGPSARAFHASSRSRHVANFASFFCDIGRLWLGSLLRVALLVADVIPRCCRPE